MSVNGFLDFFSLLLLFTSAAVAAGIVLEVLYPDCYVLVSLGSIRLVLMRLLRMDLSVLCVFFSPCFE